MEIKKGDVVITTDTNLKRNGWTGRLAKVKDISQVGYRHRYYVILLEEDVGFWCNAVPATKLHKLLLGVE